MAETVRGTRAPRKYICKTCGFIYDEAVGEPTSGIPPGTRFEDIPDDWVCSMCGDPKSEFEVLDVIDNPHEYSARQRPGSVYPLIVIGSGISAWALITELRKIGFSEQIMMITKETGDYYYKPSLSISLCKRFSREELIAESAASKAARLNVQIVSNTEAMGIDRLRKKVITDSGLFTYDQLVMATGSRACLPRSLQSQNTYTIHNIEDYLTICERLPLAKDIAIIGGGLIGCELADSLIESGKSLTLINQMPHLLAGLIPDPVAMALEQALLEREVRIINNATATRVIELPDQRARIELSYDAKPGSSPEIIDIDLIIVCIGLKANSQIGKPGGIDIGHSGITVNESLQTNDPNIYALGDCVEIDGCCHNYVDAINAQAKDLAFRIRHPSQPLSHQPAPSLIKVKTRSLPIWINSHQANPLFDRWEILKTDGQNMVVTLFHQDTARGEAYTGAYINELQHDIAPTLKRSN